jgi:hypothetical protein
MILLFDYYWSTSTCSSSSSSSGYNYSFSSHEKQSILRITITNVSQGWHWLNKYDTLPFDIVTMKLDKKNLGLCSEKILIRVNDISLKLSKYH